MKYDVIIVGAGASGMMAAITAASHHKKVLLLERMDKLGKKILATGNGRCNLSKCLHGRELLQRAETFLCLSDDRGIWIRRSHSVLLNLSECL